MIMEKEAYFRLDELPLTMDDEQFLVLIEGKGTFAKGYYQRAKDFIVRGLLDKGKGSRRLNDTWVLVGGSKKLGTKAAECRIFLRKNEHHAVLLWRGKDAEYSDSWQEIRDRLLQRL